MTDLEMAAKFREAADYLRDHGWKQGGMYTWLNDFEVDWDGPTCAAGALEMVTGNSRGLWRNPLVQAVSLRLGGTYVLPGWNDAADREIEHVVALFEDMAHDLELRHQITAGTIESSISPPPAVLSNLKEAVSVG